MLKLFHIRGLEERLKRITVIVFRARTKRRKEESLFVW